MVQKGQRIRSSPLMIPDNSESYSLNQIHPTEKLFQENWLQQLIHNNPDLLPAGEIESIFSPLISIGREVPTQVGPIDNLFISPQGYLTIVETKLWRNPEARRVVVGQIVDYAKEVNKWSFEDLDQKVRSYYFSTFGRKTGVIDLIRNCDGYEDENESELIDAITRNMKRGHFLLLIAGDGIRESVEDMAEYLSQTPQLHFTLALVELKIYKTLEGKLVLPQLVMRTREITRAIIRIEGGHVENLSVDMDLSDDMTASRSRRYSLSEEEYFTALMDNVGEVGVNQARQLIEDAQDLGCDIVWRQSSFVIRYPDPFGSKQLLTLLVIAKDGTVYTGWLNGQLRKIGISEALGVNFIERLRTILKGCEVDANKPDMWSLIKISDRYEALIDVIKEWVETISLENNESN